jgi:hypothetical protein
MCRVPPRQAATRITHPSPESPTLLPSPPPPGHTSKFGHPEPTQVRLTPKMGKAILISGHDLQDTFDLLA